MIGVVALTCVVFVFYRLLVDAAYGANNHLSEVMTIAVTVFALTWYAAFRIYRARQGADLKGQFSEIPGQLAPACCSPDARQPARTRPDAGRGVQP